jgi:hypothetical protein
MKIPAKQGVGQGMAGRQCRAWPGLVRSGSLHLCGLAWATPGEWRRQPSWMARLAASATLFDGITYGRLTVRRSIFF